MPGLGGAGVQDELDRLALTLGRSVTLDSADGTLLGHSTQHGDVDTARVESILTRRVPAAVLAYQRSFGVEEATGIIHVPANAALSMSARTCLPVRDGRATLALLWVLDDVRPLDAGEQRTVRAAGRRLRELLAPTAPRSDLGRLFAGAAPELAPELPAGRIRFVVTTGPPDEAGPLAVTSRGRVLAVRPVDVPLPPGAVVSRSDAFVAAETDAVTLARLAARAIVAADCASADPVLPRAIGWDDLGPYRQLLRETRSNGWPWPLPLPDDGPSAAMLRHTLEVHLDHAGDVSRCLAALRIHRTTFYYRLERLKDRYGIDLGDGLARTSWHLALKTARLATARERFGWTPALLARL